MPCVKLQRELCTLCQRYGTVTHFKKLSQYPCPPFTEAYLVKYDSVGCARFSKKRLDGKNFFGGIFHVFYAPELENVEETRSKLGERRNAIKKAIVRNETRKQGPESGINSNCSLLNAYHPDDKLAASIKRISQRMGGETETSNTSTCGDHQSYTSTQYNNKTNCIEAITCQQGSSVYNEQNSNVHPAYSQDLDSEHFKTNKSHSQHLNSISSSRMLHQDTFAGPSTYNSGYNQTRNTNIHLEQQHSNSINIHLGQNLNSSPVTTPSLCNKTNITTTNDTITLPAPPSFIGPSNSYSSLCSNTTTNDTNHNITLLAEPKGNPSQQSLLPSDPCHHQRVQLASNDTNTYATAPLAASSWSLYPSTSSTFESGLGDVSEETYPSSSCYTKTTYKKSASGRSRPLRSKTIRPTKAYLADTRAGTARGGRDTNPPDSKYPRMGQEYPRLDPDYSISDPKYPRSDPNCPRVIKPKPNYTKVLVGPRPKPPRPGSEQLSRLQDLLTVALPSPPTNVRPAPPRPKQKMVVAKGVKLL